MSTTYRIKLPKPHCKKQEAMITYPGNVVAFCGRRFGKTDAYVQRIFYQMVKKPGMYWWVGLSWRSASMKRAWRLVSKIARQILAGMGLNAKDYINRSNYEIRLPGLGEIWFRTADNPPSLAGEGIMGAVLDEFSLMLEIVWTEYIQATLLDHGGWVAMGGVPKGNNWAAQIWRKAATLAGWLQIHATTYDNPFISKEAIDAIKKEISDRLFGQEYLALVVADGAGIFRYVRDRATGKPQENNNGRQTVAGLDWAMDIDFSVLSIWDVATKTEIYLDRFNGIPYTLQRARIRAVCKRFGVSVIVGEENAMGRTNNAELRKAETREDGKKDEGLTVRDFTTTNTTKAEIIESLAAAFENGYCTVLDDETGIIEMENFEGNRLKSGAVQYSAPEGLHDDIVMARALGYSACLIKKRVPIGPVGIAGTPAGRY